VAFHGRLVREAGQGTAGTLYEFTVESVDRGNVTAPAIVDIDVDREVTGPSGERLRQTSSESIGAAPVPGRRYHVEAYVGTYAPGAPRLFLNGCGGKLEEAVQSDSTTASNAGGVSHRDPHPSGAARAVGLMVAGAGAVTIAVAVGLLRRRRDVG
jgi:hypothetical protein